MRRFKGIRRSEPAQIAKVLERQNPLGAPITGGAAGSFLTSAIFRRSFLISAVTFGVAFTDRLR